MIMKRLFIGTAVLAAAAFCFTGCSDKKQSPENDASSIAGTWLLSGTEEQSRGYIFDEKGNVSLYSDISDSMHFEDGDFVFCENRIENEMIKYDGDILSIKYMDELALVLDRIGDPVPDTFDGEYMLGECVMKKALAQGMTSSFDMVPEMCVSVEKDSTMLVAIGVMNYKFSGDSIEFSNYIGGLSVVDDISGKAELDGDTLTIECKNGTKRVLERQE